MDQSTWLFVGLLAGVVSAGTFRDLDEAIFGLAGALLWAYWSYGATAVEIVSETGTVTTYQYPGLALLGAGFTAIMGAVWLQGAAVAVRPDRDQGDGMESRPR